jgi:hypothetical protein
MVFGQNLEHFAREFARLDACRCPVFAEDSDPSGDDVIIHRVGCPNA